MLLLAKQLRRDVARFKRDEKEVGKGGLASQRGASQNKRDSTGGLTYR
jgi:hypothetical protein